MATDYPQRCSENWMSQFTEKTIQLVLLRKWRLEIEQQTSVAKLPEIRIPRQIFPNSAVTQTLTTPTLLYHPKINIQG